MDPKCPKIAATAVLNSWRRHLKSTTCSRCMSWVRLITEQCSVVLLHKYKWYLHVRNVHNHFVDSMSFMPLNKGNSPKAQLHMYTP